MPERHITVQRRMSASTGSVWARFADFPNLARHFGVVPRYRQSMRGESRTGAAEVRALGTAPVSGAGR